jgi:hypothetical protein
MQGNKEQELTEAVEDLRKVASLSPNNMQAVEAIEADTLCSLLVGVITERAVLGAKQELLAKGATAASSSVRADKPDGSYSKDAVDVLVAQNDALFTDVGRHTNSLCLLHPRATFI